MKSIRVLTPDLQLLAEIDDYESLQFTSSFYGIGSFELRINNNKQHVEKLQKRNLIMIGSDTEKVGIIQFREIAFDESGKQSEQWVIQGSTLETITNQRVTIPPVDSDTENHKGSGEYVIKQYVNSNLVNPLDESRKIDLVEIAPDLARGLNTDFSARYENLSEVIQTIAEVSEIGWKIYIDADKNKWVFDCYEGTDRTANQEENPPIIFSTDFETLQGASFTDSDFNLKNLIYLGGQGTGVERLVAEVGEKHTGLNRFEKFSDARHIEELDGLLKQGESELVEFRSEPSFEGTINNHSTFQYEKDWFLGDIVTVVHGGWGVEMHPRITEVKEIYEPSGYRIEATFGKANPTLVTKIKSELKQVTSLVRA